MIVRTTRKRPSTTNNCSGKGWTRTIVHYGDSRVIVVPLSKVKAGQEFRFYLIPQLKGRGATDYTNANVTIDGKRSPEDDWFTPISGQASDTYIFKCVDASLPVNATVEYNVDVRFAGDTEPRALLDPRAIVIE